MIFKFSFSANSIQKDECQAIDIYPILLFHFLCSLVGYFDLAGIVAHGIQLLYSVFGGGSLRVKNYYVKMKMKMKGER